MCKKLKPQQVYTLLSLKTFYQRKSEVYKNTVSQLQIAIVLVNLKENSFGNLFGVKQNTEVYAFEETLTSLLHKRECLHENTASCFIISLIKNSATTKFNVKLKSSDRITNELLVYKVLASMFMF